MRGELLERSSPRTPFKNFYTKGNYKIIVLLPLLQNCKLNWDYIL